MSQPAHPHAMQPATEGRTRTAPPTKPESWEQGQLRSYTLFGATGIIYLLIGFVVLGIVYSLTAGPEAWAAQLLRLTHPAYIAFHLLTFISLLFVGVRFFSLFPKAQPPRIGPAKPPPGPVITVGLYAAWIGATVAISAVLAGVIL